MITILNAEIKIVKLDEAPIVVMKNLNQNQNKYLLENMNDKIIVFERSNKQIVVEIWKNDKFEKIVAYDSSN